MPALENPRHEAFAYAIFAGLSGETRIDRAASTAYLTAYPNCSPGNSAEAAASRLLRRVKPITERVLELQAEQRKRLEQKLDLSKERVGKRLDLASQIAEKQGNAQGIATAEMGIAKVFGHITDEVEVAKGDFTNVKSLDDIGRALLAQCGLASPSAAAIQLAIEANDAFIARLREISEMHQGVVLEHEAVAG